MATYSDSQRLFLENIEDRQNVVLQTYGFTARTVHTAIHHGLVAEVKDRLVLTSAGRAVLAKGKRR